MKRGSKKQQEARRIMAAEMFEQEIKPVEIARRLSATRGAVSQWKKVWDQLGKEGLRSKAHPGRIPALSEQNRQRLAELLKEGAVSHGFSNELWTLPRVAKIIESEFNIKYHPAHVSRILRQMRWSNQKPEKQAKEKDEKEVKRWRGEQWSDKKSPKRE